MSFSGHPAKAGLQVALVDTLLDFGAALEGRGSGEWTSPLMTALAGEDPNRYNPKGNHGHSTPLHQAVWSGHEMVVRLLVERGARLDIKDTIYEGTPLGWATHGGRTDIAAYLRAQGTKTVES